MKKSLLLVLGAALLFVGCSKELESQVNELTSRMDAVETQVAANKAAIEALQKCKFISSVSETSTGWVIETSTGEKLALYNGTNGKDGSAGAAGTNGDAFFKSVTIQDGSVLFVLTDGTEITVPYAAAFELVLETNDLVVYPGQEVSVPFTITGKTEKTTVYAIAGGEYIADVEGDKVVITLPENIYRNRILVCADNGEGKTSIKAIDIDGEIIKAASVNATAGFWGEKVKVTVPTNVAVTAELENSADAVWCSVEETKAVTDHIFTVTMKATPLVAARSTNVLVKDPAGNTVDTVKVSQYGTDKGVYCAETGAFYYKLQDAVNAAEALTDKNTVTLYISQSAGYCTVYEYVNIPENSTKAYTVTARTFGATPAADPKHCTIRGINVLGNVDVTASNVRFLADGGTKNAETGQFGTYGYSLYVGKNVKSNISCDNVTFFTYQTFAKNEATHVAVQLGSTANVNIQNCYFDGTPMDNDTQVNTSVDKNARIAQIYGGKVTFKNNTIKNGYSSYAVRVGLGADVTLTGNLVDTKKFVDVYSNATDGTATKLTLGDGVADDNHYSANVETCVNDRTSGAATILPATAVGAPSGTGNILWNGYKFSTIQSVAQFADEGEITIPAGKYSENVKVAAGKNLTFIGEDGAIIAGDVEVMGDVTFKNFTIQSENGVTKKEFLSGDDYNAWWGFIVRAGSGSKLTLENCTIVADANYAGDTEAGQYISALFAAQADVTLKDCNFDLASGKLFAPTQFFECTTNITGTTFTTAETISTGCEKYVLKFAGKNTNATIAGNTFNSAEATWICTDSGYAAEGTITFGDGTADDNVYGARMEKAINCALTEAEMPNLVIKPTGLSFNKKSTSGYVLSTVWAKFDDSDWNANFGVGINGDDAASRIGDCRFMAMNSTGLYTVTGERNEVDNRDKWAYRFSLEDGSLMAKDTVPETENTGLFWLSGMTSMDDGTLLVSNMVLNATTPKGPVRMYTLDENCKFTKVFEKTITQKDGNGRLGDVLCSSGTFQDGYIYLPDYTYPSCRIFRYGVKSGKIDDDYTCWYNYGWPNTYSKASFFSFTEKYKENVFAYTVDGSHLLKITLLNEGIPQCNSKTDIVLADVAITANGTGTSYLRSPKFFSVGEEDFMAILETINANGSATFGAKLHIYALPTKDPVTDLQGAKAVATYEVKSESKNGNGLGSIDVIQKDDKTYIGMFVRNTGAAVFEFGE